MARVFDNIERDLLTALRGTTKVSRRSNFCVRYLNAKLDGLVAHLYGLTGAEFAHVLGIFSPVAEPTKIAALIAWRDVDQGLIQ